jgi:hypothetical protein
MAKVKLQAGVQPILSTIGGVTWYSRNGSQIARQRVTPNQVSSPAKLAEVSQIVMASKAWAYKLTPSQKVGYSNLACVAGSGINALQAQWSWIIQGFPANPPISPFTCPLLPCDFSSSCWSGNPATIPVHLGEGSVPGADHGYIVGVGPMGLGVFPQGYQAKKIAFGLSLPFDGDIGPQYRAKFGSDPTPGQVLLLGARVANSSSGGVSSTVWINVPMCAPVAVFQQAPDPVVIPQFVSGGAFQGRLTFSQWHNAEYEVIATEPPWICETVGAAREGQWSDFTIRSGITQVGDYAPQIELRRLSQPGSLFFNVRVRKVA